MDLKTCLYVGFALYTIFVIYVGFIGSKKIKGLSDFAVASESMGPISLGLAFAASFFSAATFLGYVGYAYAWGASALWIFLAIFGGSTLGFIVIAKGVRDSNTKIKALSLPDWLGEMYKRDFLKRSHIYSEDFPKYYSQFATTPSHILSDTCLTILSSYIQNIYSLHWRGRSGLYQS